MLEFSTYHKILRISVLTLALVLLFQSGLVSEKTAELSLGGQEFMANAVGVYVGVAPTELNQMTSEITAQKLALDKREQALSEREIAVGISQDDGLSQNTTTFILSALVFILLVLMILNYTLDYTRMRRTERILASQDITAFP